MNTGKFLYKDSDHMSSKGSIKLFQHLKPPVKGSATKRIHGIIRFTKAIAVNTSAAAPAGKHLNKTGFCGSYRGSLWEKCPCMMNNASNV